MSRVALFCLVLALSCVVNAERFADKLRDRHFLQPISTRYTMGGVTLANWKQLNMPPALQVAAAVPQASKASALDSVFFLLSESGIYSFNAATGTIAPLQLTGLPAGQKFSAFYYEDQTMRFYIGGHNNMVCKCSFDGVSAASCSLLSTTSTPSLGSITQIHYSTNGNLWIGSTAGLFVIPGIASSAIMPIPAVKEGVMSLSEDHSGLVLAGTTTFLYVQLDNTKIFDPSSWYFIRTPGVIDDSPMSLGKDWEGRVWIGNSICVNVLHTNFTLQKIDGYQGLPTSNITSISAHHGAKSIWMGTKRGIVRWQPQTAAEWKGYDFRYFYGPRWLPGDQSFSGQEVLSIAAGTVDGNECAVAVSNLPGLAVICMTPMTLAKKVEYFQKTADRPCHNRWGLMSEASSTVFGLFDDAHCQAAGSENSGLWNAIYLASQCFRYAATKDPVARQNALNSFGGMELLVKVTGIRGLPARDLVKTNTPPPMWRKSTTMDGYWWQGDTSSDEITGHLFVYGIFYDLVASTADEKDRAKQLIVDITGYIQKNNWYLYDSTGNKTRWGNWNPASLNGDESWEDTRGVNSNEILSYLASAYRVSKDSTFLDGLKSLTTQYRYDINIVNLKITQDDDTNYSDDELTYLPYYSYMMSASDLKEKLLSPAFDLSIQRTFEITRWYRPSPWNIIYLVYLKEYAKVSPHSIDPKIIEDAWWTLATYPVDQVEWNVDNSQRQDMWVFPFLSSTNRRIMNRLVPYDENSVYRWNSDPRVLKGGNGFMEMDPSVFLFPYYMGMYYDLF